MNALAKNTFLFAYFIISFFGHVDAACEFSVYSDLLYLKTFENGLTCDCESNFEKHNWNPGYRFGAEFSFPCSCVYANLFFTHYHSQIHRGKKCHSDEESYNSSEGSYSELNEESSSKWNEGSRNKWKLDFNVADLILAHTYSFYDCTLLAPYIGLRGASIYQKLNSDQMTKQQSTTEDTRIVIEKNNKENFYGGGPLVGIEANWFLCKGFSFFGNLSSSVLYGQFKIDLDETRTFLDPELETFCCHKDFWCDACVCAADVALGFQWKKWCCAKEMFTLKLCWEHHRYFDFNRLGDYGDLCLDGVTLSVGLGF